MTTDSDPFEPAKLIIREGDDRGFFDRFGGIGWYATHVTMLPFATHRVEGLHSPLRHLRYTSWRHEHIYHRERRSWAAPRMGGWRLAYPLRPKPNQYIYYEGWGMTKGAAAGATLNIDPSNPDLLRPRGAKGVPMSTMYVRIRHAKPDGGSELNDHMTKLRFVGDSEAARKGQTDGGKT